MEPSLPRPIQSSPEAGPGVSPGAAPEVGRVAPQPHEVLAPRAPEAAPAHQETYEATGNVLGGGDPAFQAAQAAAQPSTPPVQPAVPAAADPVSHDANPLVADDADLIEKEWVDRAKKVVESTRDDPYAQKREISKLQADYLKKRYGKDVVVPAD